MENEQPSRLPDAIFKQRNTVKELLLKDSFSYFDLLILILFYKILTWGLVYVVN